MAINCSSCARYFEVPDAAVTDYDSVLLAASVGLADTGDAPALLLFAFGYGKPTVTTPPGPIFPFGVCLARLKLWAVLIMFM